MNLGAWSKSVDRTFFEKVAGHDKKENVLTLGAGSYMVRGELSVFAENLNSPHILVGRFCSLANGIHFLIGGNHDYRNVSNFPFDVDYIVKRCLGLYDPLPYNRPNSFQILIGHDVWIGQNVMIMGGVKIGSGAVVGAGSVVAKDIPPYAIVVGNPAQIIKYRFDKKTIQKLLAIKWWNWNLKRIADNLPLMNDIEKFLESNYSLDLEEFPEDDFTRQINSAAKFGGYIYHFIPDFSVQDSLWINVIKDFRQSDLKDSLLVIWRDKNSTEEDLRSLTEAIGDNKNILVFKHDKNFSPTALRKGTHFITTREMTSFEALDYLWDTDVKIVSALDNGIFSR